MEKIVIESGMALPEELKEKLEKEFSKFIKYANSKAIASHIFRMQKILKYYKKLTGNIFPPQYGKFKYWEKIYVRYSRNLKILERMEDLHAKGFIEKNLEDFVTSEIYREFISAYRNSVLKDLKSLGYIDYSIVLSTPIEMIWYEKDSEFFNDVAWMFSLKDILRGIVELRVIVETVTKFINFQNKFEDFLLAPFRMFIKH